MNPLTGWTLALLALATSAYAYGWQGAVFAVTVIVFWLLLQFNRVLRTMRRASEAPVGHVDSAVMLHSKLRPGLPMLQVVKLTRSLGRRVSETPEVWAWADASGAQVAITFEGGRCRHWALTRTEPADTDADPTMNADTPDERAVPE
jgi:uncharacterized protein (DUF58 family)